MGIISFYAKMIISVLMCFHITLSCAQETQSIEYSRADSILANSILYEAYQREALYTLSTDLKPISTIKHFSIEFDTLTLQLVNLDDIAGIQQLEKVSEWLSNNTFTFIIIPLKNMYNHQRVLQLLVVNRDRLASEIKHHQDFWIYWGFVPESSPKIILTTLKKV